MNIGRFCELRPRCWTFSLPQHVLVGRPVCPSAVAPTRISSSIAVAIVGMKLALMSYSARQGRSKSRQQHGFKKKNAMATALKGNQSAYALKKRANVLTSYTAQCYNDTGVTRYNLRHNGVAEADAGKSMTSGQQYSQINQVHYKNSCVNSSVQTRSKLSLRGIPLNYCISMAQCKTGILAKKRKADKDASDRKTAGKKLALSERMKMKKIKHSQKLNIQAETVQAEQIGRKAVKQGVGSKLKKKLRSHEFYDEGEEEDKCTEAGNTGLAVCALMDAPRLPVSDEFVLSRIKVESSYTGPRMEGSNKDGYSVTPEFVNKMLEEFKAGRRVHKRFAFEIILQAQKLFKAQASLVDVHVPKGTHITVCGDIHGQLEDLLHIWELNGRPAPNNPYLFNGDFVDRGLNSVEVMLALLAYKVLYPNSLWLTRGNHETQEMNKQYTFASEVKRKYDATMLGVFQETFWCMPVAYVLAGRVFVVHGGMSRRKDVTLSEIKTIDRFREPETGTLLYDLMWSDPGYCNGYSHGCRNKWGFTFGPDISKSFLDRNGLELIVRSHQHMQEGYAFHHDNKVLTIFSASDYRSMKGQNLNVAPPTPKQPSYLPAQGNKGAFIRFNGADMVPHITQFKTAPKKRQRCFWD